MTLFKQHVQYAQRLMDDFIDLEIEKIDQILAKVASDPETEDIKRVEVELWNKIKKQTLKGRRTGLGITAEGDMLAALNIRYGSDRGNAFQKRFINNWHYQPTDLQLQWLKKERIPVYSCTKEAQNPFVLRLKKQMRNYMRYG